MKQNNIKEEIEKILWDKTDRLQIIEELTTLIDKVREETKKETEENIIFNELYKKILAFRYEDWKNSMPPIKIKEESK